MTERSPASSVSSTPQEPAMTSSARAPAVRHYLYVPFGKGTEARQLGAQYDPDRKKWYARMDQDTLIRRWGTKTRRQDRVYILSLIHI